MDKDKIVVGSFAGLFTALLTAPDNVKLSLYIVFFLSALDMLTGIAAAMACKELRSSRMRTKMTMKMVQYTVILGLSYSATLMIGSWFFFEAGVAAVTGIEVTSMLENLVKWQGQSGISLGPINKIVAIASSVFDAATSHGDGDSVVTTSTVIPPNPQQQDIISVTSVKTEGRQTKTKI